MPIEGPLRELGIHDVFQLLDLSRKTGHLRVSSALRDNEGTVTFRHGRVIGARIKSNPHPLGQILLRAGKVTEAELERALAMAREPEERRQVGEILVDLGVLTRRELDRQMRRQIEAVVFELLSWEEGYFSFTEGQLEEEVADEEAGLSAESLLMEAARRIDEWTRLVHRVPGLHVIPVLAADAGDHPPMLDLRPNEWELLAAVDGVTDLRAIADRVGISDFDAARIVYGLLATGVIALREMATATSPVIEDTSMLLADARAAWRRGDLAQAAEYWRRVIEIDPDSTAGRQAQEALAHATRLRELVEVTGGTP